MGIFRRLFEKENIIDENTQMVKLVRSYKTNKAYFKQVFKNDDTAVFREFSIFQEEKRGCILYLDGMVDDSSIIMGIMEPLLRPVKNKNKIDDICDYISEKVLNSGNIIKTNDMDHIIGHCLMGDTALLIEGSEYALIIETKGFAVRSVPEPVIDNNIRGPRESFIESIMINVSLVRRKIKNSDLKFEFRKLGKRTKTDICICYLQGVVNKKILEELKRRLDEIDIDSILDSGYIEELIKDAPLSPFATLGYTEKPDNVAGNLLEGKIAIMVDGTPTAVTLPFLFMEYFQASEDYYMNFYYASINRILRYLSFFLSTSVPAIYVALVTFHQEMIPTPLILSISAAREGVPFPTILEATFMLVAFEILREAGARLPKPVGATISFVGALVLGEASVTARLVSAPMVIIAALTGITTFLVPKMLSGMMILRFTFLFLAAFLGLYGYIFGIIGLFVHLTSIRSFGVPYMMNLGGIKFQEIKDTAIRAPWWYMDLRPRLIAKQNRIRQNIPDATEKEHE